MIGFIQSATSFIHNDQNIESIRKLLLDWYQQNRRDLPWRRIDDPYRIWVSEVMLQQTQVRTVIPYYKNFLKRFPTLNHLARADMHDLLKVWEGLGYYGRARNLLRSAKSILNEHDGVIPDTWKEFRKLSGVGDYIAAAVLSIAFGRLYPVVDGNVKRLLARLFIIDTPVNGTNPNKIFKEVAGKLLDKHLPGVFNQAMMELGALVCKPKNPLCPACPIQQFCQAYQTRNVDKYPQRSNTPKTPEYHIATGVVVKKNRVLIARRKEDGLLGGLWEFPGGKVKPRETPADACVREIKEEVNLTVRIDKHLTCVRHAYTHFKIKMDVFSCRYISGRVKLSGPVAYRWITLNKIPDYPFPKANHKFLPLLNQIKMI